MNPSRISIPEEDQNILLEFFNLPEETRNSIIEFLNDDKILGLASSALTDEFNSRFPTYQVDFSSLLDVFSSMCRTKASYAFDDTNFINQISKNLSGKKFELSDKQKADVKSILNSNLLLTAKAIKLFLDVDKAYIESRIITDLRPVFGGDTEMLLIGNMITHTLKIEYGDNSDSNSRIYMTLDADDLNKLKEQIFRAEEKEKVLRTSLSNSKIFDIKLSV